MLKPVIAATAILAIAGSSIVYAQQRYGGRGFGDGGPRAEQRHRPSAEDVAAFADARIAALKAGLELTPDQARNWPTFEQALRDLAQLRVQRMQARQAAANQQTQTPTTPFDRMARRADNMTKTSAALKRIADTGAPLYMSLNDAQKNRFTTLARMLRPHHRMHANNGGNGGNGRQGQGYGRDGRGSGQDGQGWGHGRRFGQNGQDGQGWGQRDGGRFGQGGRGPGGRIHDLSDTDQDSQL